MTVLVDHRAVKIRLAEIDAPELGQPYGRRSRDALAGVCAGILASVDALGDDRYGRIVGRVYCGPLNANAAQVRAGLAWVYVRYTKPDSPLYSLQATARVQGLGLWADPKPIAPWAWRKTYK